ncbi:MAG: hypothetical protein H6819_02040 [Phycisphaerales bacterium]|nr:hypothetical protein [Phycisphaerales bacterium]MCB9857007.1 hypothetical protein [Phycisphaerales bacterium]MCB9861866.1 hypothetical protein [Phycisphaerales bacterium]
MDTQNASPDVIRDRSRRRSIAATVAVVVIALSVYAYQRNRMPNVPGIPQMWKSTGVDYANTDSVAALRHADGGVRVLATAKWGDYIDVFDGLTGRAVTRIGKTGDNPGEFRRPNGIAIARISAPAASLESDSADRRAGSVGSAIVVVEREGARVQILSADDYHPMGVVGAGVLHRPYGAALSYSEADPLLYVTDSECPAQETVSVFRLVMTADGVTGTLVRRFGDDGPGQILKAESIVIDDELGRVLLCDEDRSQRNVKVYDLNGRFSGRTFGDGIVVGDPEGIVIVKAVAGDFILLTDQRSKITIWHAFDCSTLTHVTSFTGQPRIANTDGICVFQGEFETHLEGAMFAVNDDADVRAYDLHTIITLVEGARSREPKGASE